MTVTSTVCLIAKNEAPYLIEWLAYYRVLGFNNIVIYENNSDDNSDEILKKLHIAGKVIHRTWKLGRNESPQITAYEDALRLASTDWILFVDADEFLVLHEHEKVNDFLATFSESHDVTSIGVNWRIFGNSHLETRDDRPVIERFTMAAEEKFNVNELLKSFSRVDAVGKLVHMHACETNGRMVHPSGKALEMSEWGRTDTIELTVAQVNHYYTKTIEEYGVKKMRGQGGAGENAPEVKYWYSDESFHGHNQNVVLDRSALKYFGEVKKEMEELISIVRS